MRPTDENQAESMRPNLMSPKRVRTSGEDSILAMLERDPTRKRGTGAGASPTRLAWYGASAAVAIALTGTLVWLAAGNDGLRPDVERSMMAAAPPPAPAAARPAPALVQVALAEGPSAARSGSAAVIVDQKPQDDVPPLRLLKPAPGTTAKAPAPPAAASAKPAPKAVVAAPAPAAVPPARTPAPGAAAAPRPRPVTVARNAARPAQAKAQRPATPARAAEAPVDPDVALISAVIVHANGHAPEGSQMTELLCPNDSCQARPNRQ